MPHNMEDVKEEEDDQIVTYARLADSDRTAGDRRRQMNEYVWANLPLAEEQKAEFLELLRQQNTCPLVEEHKVE